MLKTIIRFALKQRLLIIACSVFLFFVFSFLAIGYGYWKKIDVDRSLNRPRVVVITEAPGMAPAEVEDHITNPLEIVLLGSTKVQAVRSSSGTGISVIYVEFDWGTDIDKNRNIVNERLRLVTDKMPDGVKPQIAPVSSDIIVGVWSEEEKNSPADVRIVADWIVRPRLLSLRGVAKVLVFGGGRKRFQVLVDSQLMLKYKITIDEVEKALIKSTFELSQDENATGGYVQNHNPNMFFVLSKEGHSVKIKDLEKVVVKTHKGESIILRDIAKMQEALQVKPKDSSAFAKNRKFRVQQKEGQKPEYVKDEKGEYVKTADGAYVKEKNNRYRRKMKGEFVKDAKGGFVKNQKEKYVKIAGFAGGPSMILVVNKKPDTDIKEVTKAIAKAIKELKPSVPSGIHISD